MIVSNPTYKLVFDCINVKFNLFKICNKYSIVDFIIDNNMGSGSHIIIKLYSLIILFTASIKLSIIISNNLFDSVSNKALCAIGSLLNCIFL